MNASRPLKQWILGTAVFVCGAVVMIFEIVGSRMVSPFIGTSTYIWTCLIGVILASLSVGYWLGGRLADRRPEPKLLALVIFSAGGLISVAALIKDILLSFIGAAPAALEFKALAGAVLLFAPASVCLGLVTPFAVRLNITTVEATGKIVGRLYALSTVGSIAGTFAAGFFLIPFLGTNRTLYAISAALILVSAVVFPLSSARSTVAGLLIFVISIVFNETYDHMLSEKGIFDIDTQYSRVRVFQTVDPVSGKKIRALATDPYFVQSAVFLDSDDLVLAYTRYYHLLRHFKAEPLNTLMIGGAGYTFPREYLRTYQHSRIDVVEIDPRITQIARDQFRLEDDPRLNIVHEDGRMFINRAEGSAYDAVLIDAFGSLFSVPYHLTTIEAVEGVHRVLKEDGIVILNLGSSLSGSGSRFLQAELRTYRNVFPRVSVFTVNKDKTSEQLQNLIIVGCKSASCDLTNGESETIAELLRHRYTAELPLEENILTDDLAPVEYYNSSALDLYLASR